MKNIFEKACWYNIREQEEDFRCCIISSKSLSLIRWNCVMVFELIVSGHRDTTACLLV